METLKREHGNRLFEEASRYMVGGIGVGSRYFPLMGRAVYMVRGDGAYLFDVDGNKYIDLHQSGGASLLGHNHPAIRAALERALEMGFLLGYDTEYHVKLARCISEMIPSAERVRFNTSGTDAVLSALRIARAFTGRDKILKFEGHYHGLQDYLLYNSDSVLGRVLPNGEVQAAHDSAGIPKYLDALVVVLPFNDPDAFVACMRRHKGEFAAILMEPVMYNCGCILPKKDFVELVREEATRDGAVLVFDEVLSGFRMGPGGGQEYLGITPDLTCLSKALGCGMPIAAIGGKREVMEVLTPVGKTLVSGTYNAHALVVMGTLAALEEMRRPGFYQNINASASRLYGGINEILTRRKVRAVCQGLGARFGIFFGFDQGDVPITDFRMVASRFDADLDQRFVRLVFERQLFLHDGGRRQVPKHHGFSSAHTMGEIEETLDRLDDVFAAL